jgi:hypothetical protein
MGPQRALGETGLGRELKALRIRVGLKAKVLSLNLDIFQIQTTHK